MGSETGSAGVFISILMTGLELGLTLGLREAITLLRSGGRLVRVREEGGRGAEGREVGGRGVLGKVNF